MVTTSAFLASLTSAGTTDITPLVNEDDLVPVRFTASGALVGAFNHMWDVPETNPKFVYTQGQAWTFNFYPDEYYPDTSIIDVNRNGLVAGYGNYGYEWWGDLYKGFVSHQGQTSFLGTGGEPESRVSDVNEAGQIVGTIVKRDWNDGYVYLVQKATLWNAQQPDQPVELMPHPSQAVAIDEVGKVLIQATVMVSGYQRSRPFIWKNGQVTDLSSEVSLANFPSATPPNIYVSRIGETDNLLFEVVGKDFGGNRITRLATRVNGVNHRMPEDIPGWFAYTVTQDGGILYKKTDRLFLWHPGRIVDLLDLAGLPANAGVSFDPSFVSSGVVVFHHPSRGLMAYCSAQQRVHWLDVGRRGKLWGVNERGEVAGYYSDYSDSHYSEEGHAFLWKTGRTQFLETPGNGMSWAWNINEAGDVVGHSGNRTFLYRRGRVSDIGAATYLTDAPWALETALGQDGQVAFNCRVDGEDRTYVFREDLQTGEDSYSAISGGTRTVGPDFGVLANDFGGRLKATLVQGPSHGTLKLRLDGSFVYTPTAGFVGEDGFTYLAEEGDAVSEPTEVRITVAGQNSAPVIESGPEMTAPAGQLWKRGPYSLVALTVKASDANDGSGQLRYEWWRDSNRVYCVGPKLVALLTLGTHPIKLKVTDPHGAVTTKILNVTVADTEPPVISGAPESLAAFATSSLGAVVKYSPMSAWDEVQGPVEVQYSHPTGSMFPLGKTFLRAVAKDRSGNKAVAVVPVTVRYDTAGISTPTGGTVIKAGVTVPVRFALKGVSASIIDAQSKLYVRKGLEKETLVGSFAYDAIAGRYQALWNTAGLAQGQYRLRADLGDGALHSVVVKLVQE